MKHSINELYKVVGSNRIYSAQAVEFANRAKRLQTAKAGECYAIRYRICDNKPFRIYDEIGSKKYRLGWQYGEKTWFDSELERDAYREQMAAEAKAAKIQKLKDEIIRNAEMLAELGA